MESLLGSNSKPGDWRDATPDTVPPDQRFGSRCQSAVDTDLDITADSYDNIYGGTGRPAVQPIRAVSAQSDAKHCWGTGHHGRELVDGGVGFQETDRDVQSVAVGEHHHDDIQARVPGRAASQERLRQLHLVGREERVLRHERRHHLPAGAASGRAVHGRGEEPHQTEPGRIPAADGVQGQGRQRGVFQGHHVVPQS